MLKPVSERFIYHMMDESDADLLFALDQDPEVMRYINGGKMTTPTDIETVFIPRLKSYINQTEGWGLWKVMLKDTGEFVGWVLVRPMDYFTDNPKLDNLEFGWRFFQSAWGKGYATEAASAIGDCLLAASKNGEIKPVRKISAIAMAGNQGSINVMKKLGLTYVKTDIHKDPLGVIGGVFYQKKV